ncbi:MAG: hydrogenase expression/formation protein HypE [Gammaproteobacteria bacterium]|nr:hydrogenase expression/formation protein HypE [Gammaproteobacteria bacterium]
MQDTHISLAHGNGGRFMRELIEELFARHLANPLLDTTLDAAVVPLSGDDEIVVTTDGFTVQPLEFPGGNIGSLAVHGTVNDLAVAGARPLYLTLDSFIEEGLEVARLERLVTAMAGAARDSGAQIVAGDTKVLRRGEGGGVYFATTGIGVRPRGVRLGLQGVRPGDRVLVTGPVGDHGTAVMLAREQFGLRGELMSDAGSVLPAAQALLEVPGLRFMRDPTRGGLATVAHEIARGAGATVRLHEAAVPVNPPVRSVCEILGYDPYFLACEGRIVAVVDPGHVDAALAALWGPAGCPEAAVIGGLERGRDQVVLETELGGERVLEELEDDPLPRIC